jgi:calcium-dependent protein kinase
MGCNESNLGGNDYADGDESQRLNEEKTQDESWRNLPAIHFLGKKKIEKVFQVQKVLGKGGSCRVIRVKKRDTKVSYAMKELLRDDPWNPILFRQEIEILSSLRHPSILSYCESYVQDKYLYVCTKLCTGGELFDKVKKLQHFSEKQAADVMRSILEAILFVHKQKIAHRDLKPENIVYKNSKPSSPIVIIDFGDATVIESNQQVFSDFVGTPFYLAPECIRHRAGWELYASDMWAIGVIGYVLVTGRPPFWGTNNRQILMKITRAKVSWPKGVKISKSCKSFILKLLTKDCRKRATAKDALRHRWIVRDSHKYNEHLGNDLIKNLRKFQNACRLKKLIVTKMIADMSNDDKQAIACAFQQLDINGDGFVDYDEIVTYLGGTGLDAATCSARAKQLINTMDEDGDGRIDLCEWTTGKTADKLTSSAELIEEQFNRISSVASASATPAEAGQIPRSSYPARTITTEEIMQSFGGILDEAELEEIVREVDADGDGVITLHEFQNAMRQFTVRQ